MTAITITISTNIVDIINANGGPFPIKVCIDRDGQLWTPSGLPIDKLDKADIRRAGRVFAAYSTPASDCFHIDTEQLRVAIGGAQ